MSNVSVRNPSAGAYREALAAIEQFERQGVSLDSDRVFLKRLKSPRYVDEVARAWLDIADRKRPGDDLLLIKFMFAAGIMPRRRRLSQRPLGGRPKMSRRVGGVRNI